MWCTHVRELRLLKLRGKAVDLVLDVDCTAGACVP